MNFVEKRRRRVFFGRGILYSGIVIAVIFLILNLWEFRQPNIDIKMFALRFFVIEFSILFFFVSLPYVLIKQYTRTIRFSTASIECENNRYDWNDIQSIILESSGHVGRMSSPWPINIMSFHLYIVFPQKRLYFHGSQADSYEHALSTIQFIFSQVKNLDIEMYVETRMNRLSSEQRSFYFQEIQSLQSHPLPQWRQVAIRLYNQFVLGLLILVFLLEWAYFINIV